MQQGEPFIRQGGNIYYLDATADGDVLMVQSIHRDLENGDGIEISYNDEEACGVMFDMISDVEQIECEAIYHMLKLLRAMWEVFERSVGDICPPQPDI